MGKYFAIFKLSFSHAICNYKGLIGLSIFLLTCLVIFSNLWKVAAINDLNPGTLLWYITFNEWVYISLPDVEDSMEQDLRSGRLAYLLPRPISYLGATLAHAIGALVANLLILGIVGFAFTYFMVGSIPFSPLAMVLAIVLGFIAGLVGVFFLTGIGLSAFWFNEVGPMYWIWEKLFFMLGALMLPLTAYPEWLQAIAKWTPFPAMLGERSALSLEFSYEKVAFLFLSLAFWGCVGIVIIFFLYRRGLKILNIEGG